MKALKQHKETLKKINIFIEALAIFGMYWLATLLRFKLPFGTAFSIFDSVKFMALAFVFTFIIILVTYLNGDYFTFHIDSIPSEMRKVFVSTVIGVCVDCTIIYLFKLEQFSRLLLIYFAILAYFIILVKRIILGKYAKYYDKKYRINNNVIMIGSGRSAVTAYKTIFANKVKNMTLIGYFADCENKEIPGYFGKVKSVDQIFVDDDLDMIIIADENIDRDTIRDIVIMASNHNIRVCIIPEFTDYMPSKNAISLLGGNYLCELTALDTCDIMGVNISVTNMEKTVNKIKDNLNDWSGKYICVSNVHTTVTASEDEDYKTIQNKAVIALPDGGPLSKFSREQGYTGAARVTGPDLMQRILKESAKNGWKHYFYGSTQETLDKLKSVIDERYPGTNVVGMMSPPFRSLTIAEDTAIIREINKTEPDFIWVGLGAPKQEIWMAAHEDKVKGLMIGVGAAFDYEVGNIKRAPQWMQKHNLEWAYRLMQDPRRLLSRYLKTNTKYLIWKYQHGGK